MPATISNARLLTPRQVADRLGQNEDSIRRAIREGRIPAKKISGRIYVNEAAITPPAELPAEPTKPGGDA
ncbi:MAG TPA: helix-turn-helix domain-containing protein [Rubricoccaceae bacterium]